MYHFTRNKKIVNDNMYSFCHTICNKSECAHFSCRVLGPRLGENLHVLVWVWSASAGLPPPAQLPTASPPLASAPQQILQRAVLTNAAQSLYPHPEHGLIWDVHIHKREQIQFLNVFHFHSCGQLIYEIPNKFDRGCSEVNAPCMSGSAIASINFKTRSFRLSSFIMR